MSEQEVFSLEERLVKNVTREYSRGSRGAAFGGQLVEMLEQLYYEHKVFDEKDMADLSFVLRDSFTEVYE